MLRTGLTIRSGLLVALAVACIPGAYRAGQINGYRQGEKRTETVMKADVDGHLLGWLQDDQRWLQLRECILSERIRPSSAPYWRDRPPSRGSLTLQD